MYFNKMCGHVDVPINSNAIHYLDECEKMWPVKDLLPIDLFYRLKGV